MFDDNKDELEDEIVKSLEKMVEEETSVAKAFVDNQKENANDSYAKENIDAAMGKTRVIPKVTPDMLTKNNEDIQKTGIYNAEQVKNIADNMPVTAEIPRINPESESIYKKDTVSKDTGMYSKMGDTTQLTNNIYKDKDSVEYHHNNKTVNHSKVADSNMAANHNRTRTADDKVLSRSRMSDSSIVNNNTTDNNKPVNHSKPADKDRTVNNNKVADKNRSVNHNRNTDNGRVLSDKAIDNRSVNYNKSLDNQAVDNNITKTGMDTRKKKAAITAVCIIAGIVLVIGIVAGIIINNKNKESYDYNYDKGMSSYKSRDYESAINYLSKAAKLTEGKKNTELKYTLYECYLAEDDIDMQIEMLKDILSFDENNEKSLKALAKVYEEKKDGDALNALIKSYRNKEGYKYLSDYVVEKPAASIEAGTYEDDISLMFSVDTGYSVYYTTDKTEPTNKSTMYTGSPIDITKGTTTVKVVAVNSIGVYSDVEELVYTVDYKKPSAPTVSPESGTYEKGQQVTVSNIPSGYTAYYTLDGSTPSANSEIYDEPFDIPEGNNVISVVIIDTHNQMSNVVKRNYVVNKPRTLSYNESLEILKGKMISDGVLKSDGNTTKDGYSVTFVYQSKTTVDSIEMYIIRYDVTNSSGVSTAGYYGVATKSGNCYKVTYENNSYSASEY